MLLQTLQLLSKNTNYLSGGFLKRQLAYNFARKVKSPIQNKASFTSDKQLSQSQSSSSKILHQSQQQKSLNQTQEKVTPEYLEYQNQVKQKIRMKIAQQLQYNQSYQGQDPTPTKLVSRPNKEAVWGLGGQLIIANRKVHLQGLTDDIDQIIEFLQLHQVKDIYVHDFHKENPQRPETNKKRYHLIGSCFSSRHCWKISTQLKNAFNLYSGKSVFKKRGRNGFVQRFDPIYATRTGSKDQQYCLVEYKDYSINLMTVDQREAMDLEWKWNNEPDQQTVSKLKSALLDKKRRRNHVSNL